ncbi:hypothetical protein KDRO_E00220 [Kluyveromyces lactis]|nr:hypothetical protein KDRO_E00220 [Kluyveromyces lactis]
MSALAMTLDHNLTAFQTDISSEYLYAELKEELYPRSRPRMNSRNKVLKLNKSLYGLKQSRANWYALIKQFLIEECGLIEDGAACVHIQGTIETPICPCADDTLAVV